MIENDDEGEGQVMRLRQNVSERITEREPIIAKNEENISISLKDSENYSVTTGLRGNKSSLIFNTANIAQSISNEESTKLQAMNIINIINRNDNGKIEECENELNVSKLSNNEVV